MKAIIFTLLATLPALAELQLVSGHGQLAFEQTVSQPMVVRAVDAAGRPIPGLAVNFAITQGQGTLLSGGSRTTDESGFASVQFVTTSIQPGSSWDQATVTATSTVGTVPFIITTVQFSTGAGLAPLPLVQYVGEGSLGGPAGSTIRNAFRIQVAASAGVRLGQGIPNVGVRLVLPSGADPAAAPFGACAAPGGVALTGADGFATCDLVLNRNIGTGSFTALVGEVINSRGVQLEITAPEPCSVTLSANSQTFGAAGGTGTVGVTANDCGWTAQSNVNWISLTSGSTGSGTGSVHFSVAANGGAARTGTISIGNRTFTVNQNAAGTAGGSLSFSVSPALPSGTVGSPYSYNLVVFGGSAPYTWSTTGSLPPGLTLSAAAGTLSGVPSAAGNYSLPVTVRDAAGATVSQTFTLAVNQTSSPGSGPVLITTTSFPSGSLGVPYSHLVTATGGCPNPFAGGPRITLEGSLPPGLTLQSATGGMLVAGTPTTVGRYTFALRATDACGASTTRDFTITIGATPSSIPMTASAIALSFNAQRGTSAPLDRTLRIETGETSIAFKAVATTPQGNWLSVTPSVGNTAADLVVRISNYAGLGVGVYQGNIAIDSQAPNSPLNVPVTLTITDPVSFIPAMTSSPPTLTLAVNRGDTTPLNMTVGIETGTIRAAFTVAAISEGGNWLSASPVSGTTPANISVQVANYAGLPAGTYRGNITIISLAPNSPFVIPVELMVADVAAGLSATPSSLRFESAQGGIAPQPQTLNVNSAMPASFTLQPAVPWLSATPNLAITPASISVTVNPAGLPPGTHEGSLAISQVGSTTPLTVPVTLVIGQADLRPQIASVTNGASFLEGPVAPGEIVTIFGSGLGPQTLATLGLTAAGTIDTSLANVRVWFDEQLAPIIHAASTQVTVVAPYTLQGKQTVRVVVERDGIESAVRQVPVAPSAPGLFTIGGTTQGAIINQDGTVNSAQNPAAPGSVISIFATGEGQTAPLGVEGAIASADALAKPLLPVTVTIGGRESRLMYAGSAPIQPVGLMQVNATVPADTPAGAVPVTLTVGSATSQPGVIVHVRAQ